MPPDELKLILCPAHKVEGVAAAVATGNPLTVMTVNALPGHDLLLLQDRLLSQLETLLLKGCSSCVP